MMSKFAQFYPQIRLAIYGILTAVLGAAGLFGLISEDESTAYLGYAASALGALGTLLALVNVKSAAPTVDTPALAQEVAVRINTDINQAAQSTVAELRRRAEQAFGEFR